MHEQAVLKERDSFLAGAKLPEFNAPVQQAWMCFNEEYVEATFSPWRDREQLKWTLEELELKWNSTAGVSVISPGDEVICDPCPPMIQSGWFYYQIHITFFTPRYPVGY
jgi:hypothetical protein